MNIAAGQQLLHYRVIEKIGEGGMGVVWRAVDTTLDRDVAIKILPEVFSADSERMTRFEREAKTLASLNHPCIAGIYGLHETDGARFIAMEFIGGEDLAERISRGALTEEDALDIARQVAQALEAAHEIGVVHRDLKPTNIRLTPQGQVKVLDFGLAKALDPTSSGPGSDALGLSPTVTSAGTVAGTILGTAAYMSPEQAKGKPVDRRADVWAFGCVLFEMLTGRQLFEAETVSETLAAVLMTEPAFDALPTRTSAQTRWLLQRCLAKDPRTRLRDIGEARVAAEHPDSWVPGPAGSPDGAVATSTRPRWLLPLGAVALVAAAFLLGTLLRSSGSSPVATHRSGPPTGGKWPTTTTTRSGASASTVASLR